MTELAPLEALYETIQENDLPLPDTLVQLYGRLQFPVRDNKPYIIGNFVTTLDGVVSLRVPGHEGGGDISGFNQHDRMVMGLLRAVSDMVIVGSGTVHSVPGHLWTAGHVYPPLAEEYGQLRSSLGKPGLPLNVIVSGSGKIDHNLRVISSGEVPVLIVTTAQGAEQINQQPMPPSVKVIAVAEDGPISAASILNAAYEVRQSDLVLVEGGPQLIGDFFAERYLDELFLTLAPQIAGRDDETRRPGLVSGKVFAPENPLWGTLASVKRAGSHLFLRYKLEYAN